jgi:hypothetical protein
MKNNKFLGLGLVALAFLGLGLFVGYESKKYLNEDKGPTVDYWSKDYKPRFDSLFMELKNLKIDTSGFSSIKPLVTYIYLPSKPLPPQKVECNTDSLLVVLDSLKNNQIKIPLSFITLFPNNPKLISMGLTKDSLTWDLLFPDGSSRKEYYPLDFNSYRYLYKYPTLRATEIQKSKSNNVESNLYINSGIITYQFSPFIDLQYEIHLKRYKIETRASYLITPNLPMISAGIGYKIK